MESDYCAISPTDTMLDLIDIRVSEQSIDYVSTKSQFHLHHLLTEQRHSLTANLSRDIRTNTTIGLRSILDVDADISSTFVNVIAPNQAHILTNASTAIVTAIRNRHRIYVYGCGATGRLAKQIESSFWRPFWRRLRSLSIVPIEFIDYVENALVGEMTGADRALISSLEGFEDLQLIGKLQAIDDHRIARGDVVFAISEGGETSSVIGTIRAARQLYDNADEAAHQLYFIYNNPDRLLSSLDRCQSVLVDVGITKLCLCTGPQAIAGSTRMQATTSETFVLAIIIEHAIYQVLASMLDDTQLSTIGFGSNVSIIDRLLSFTSIQSSVCRIASELARFTDIETDTYAHGHRSIYFADQALITVFTDATERAPTFRLAPLDTINDVNNRKSWIQVWTAASNASSAWHHFLGRQFHGLDPKIYHDPFVNQVNDRYLQKAALTSLDNAGDDQQLLYDFSLSPSNIQRFGPQSGDLGVLILVADECNQLPNYAIKWLNLFATISDAKVVVILVSNDVLIDSAAKLQIVDKVKQTCSNGFVITVQLDNCCHDPLQIRQHIALKMLLNAHSTGVMAKLGRLVGNTMTNVNPANLKLIGRATYLIMMHVNEKLTSKTNDDGRRRILTYADANAVLFDVIDYSKSVGKVNQCAEVALAIVRILQSIRTGSSLTWPATETLLHHCGGLENYLNQY